MCTSNMIVLIKREVLYITIFDNIYEIHAYTFVYFRFKAAVWEIGAKGTMFLNKRDQY